MHSALALLQSCSLTVRFVGYVPMDGIGFHSWDSTMLLQVNGKISVMYMMWDARMVLELGTTFYLEICRTGHNRPTNYFKHCFISAQSILIPC
jgi:hypothetical protein